MPSDSNGQYSLPPGYVAETGQVIQASQHNPPLEDLATAMSGRLPRSGNAAMLGPLKIVNGSAAAPGLAFATDTSSGLVKTADGWGVSVGGTLVAEFANGMMKRGSRFIGEIIDLSFSTVVPPLCVRLFGQTLSRAAYPELWALAQQEIANGNNFYNNGDGSTTFGIADMRGRYRFTRDNLGGVYANRITLPYFANAGTVGQVGGSQAYLIGTQHLPPYTPQGYVQVNGVRNGVSRDRVSQASQTNGTANSSGGTGGYWLGGRSDILNEEFNYAFEGIPQGGQNSFFNVLPPSVVTDCAIFAGA